jgi:hypothetical protein
LDLSAAINYRVVIPVAIAVVIFLDDNCVPIPMLVAIANDRAVVVSVAVAVMPFADRYADRSDADSNLFRARRDDGTEARNRGNYQSVFHHVLQILLNHAG